MKYKCNRLNSERKFHISGIVIGIDNQKLSFNFYCRKRGTGCQSSVTSNETYPQVTLATSTIYSKEEDLADF